MKVNVKKFVRTVSESQSNLLLSAYKICVVSVANVHWIHWHAKGPKFDRIHGMADEYYSKLNENLDALAELNLQHGVSLINPLNVVGEFIEMPNLGYEDTIDFLKDIIGNYINKLTSLRNSLEGFPGDQSAIDDMIAYWDKELNYKLDRR